jgi:hypothetical protein
VKFEPGQKVYVHCGEFIYHGLVDVADETFLHLENADLFVLDQEGEMHGTAIHGRDTAIRLEKVDAIIDGTEDLGEEEDIEDED